MQTYSHRTSDVPVCIENRKGHAVGTKGTRLITWWLQRHHYSRRLFNGSWMTISSDELAFFLLHLGSLSQCGWTIDLCLFWLLTLRRRLLLLCFSIIKEGGISTRAQQHDKSISPPATEDEWARGPTWWTLFLFHEYLVYKTSPLYIFSVAQNVRPKGSGECRKGSLWSVSVFCHRVSLPGRRPLFQYPRKQAGGHSRDACLPTKLRTRYCVQVRDLHN